MEAGALSGMCYRIICQQHYFGANFNVAANSSVCAYIVCEKWRRLIQVPVRPQHPLLPAAVFVGGATEILSGGHCTNRYSGCWFDSAPPLSGAELSSSLSPANPLQVLSSASSNAASNSSVVPTLLSSATLQSRPGTKTGIGSLYRIYRVRIPVKRRIPKCCTAARDLATRLAAHTYYCSIRPNSCTPW